MPFSLELDSSRGFCCVACDNELMMMNRVFNAFSPYNNVVGWASNDLEVLQAHFEAARRHEK